MPLSLDLFLSEKDPCRKEHPDPGGGGTVAVSGQLVRLTLHILPLQVTQLLQVT